MLVSDLIISVLPRLGNLEKNSGISVYQAATSIQSLICKNLINRKSDLQVTGSMNIQIPAFGYYGTLPTDFIAPAEKPYSEDLVDNWMAGTVTSYDSVTGSLVMNVTSNSGSETLTDWYIAMAGVPGVPASNIGSSLTSITTGTGSKTFVTQAGLVLPTGQYLIISGESSPTGWHGRRRTLQPNYLGDDEEQQHDLRWWEDYAFFYDEPIAYTRPSRYKIIGSTIYIRPKPIVDVLIKCRYYALPVALTTASQTILWNGLFDEIFIEGVIRIIIKGTAIPEADADFMVFFNREFNFVLNARSRLIPKRHRTKRDSFL
jgi:hypothetical protein